MSIHVLVMNGPNLNRLGIREPSLYGTGTLDDIESELLHLGRELSIDLQFFQSSQEGVLVDRIHQAVDEGVDGFLVNLGAYTHTSIALRDAFLSAARPFVEVHISNVFRRETFRHTSLISDIAAGVLVGFGPFGYQMGLRGLEMKIRSAGGDYSKRDTPGTPGR
ncbi:MAG: type II 3-dehydroquinate dehydratase [Leptospirales bacterium]